MNQDDLQNTVLIGLAARGILRINAMQKEAMRQKQAGYNPEITPNQYGTAIGGTIIGSLVQAARGKALLQRSQQ